MNKQFNYTMFLPNHTYAEFFIQRRTMISFRRPGKNLMRNQTIINLTLIITPKDGFTQYPIFVGFFTFLFVREKVAIFYPHLYMSISALTRKSHIGQKFSEKIFLK